MQPNEENGRAESDLVYAMVLFFFLLKIRDQNKDAWEKFAHDLIYENRFSSHSPVVSELNKRAEQAVLQYSKGTVFYRARKMKDRAQSVFYNEYLKNERPQGKEAFQKTTNTSDVDQMLDMLSNLFQCDNSEEGCILRPKQNIDWWTENRFQGFDAEESTAPPKEFVSSGRANPAHIRYLYLSEDSVTPVYEVRPIVGQDVSVAKFVLQKDIKVFDFSLNIQDENGFPTLYNLIGEMFSKPNDGNEVDYLPTQFLVEKIKNQTNMNFDGIRFKSSLNTDGYNVVLFDPSACKAVSSKIVTVNKISLDIKQFDPFLLENSKEEANRVQNDA